MGVDYLASQAAMAEESRVARTMHMTRAQLEGLTESSENDKKPEQSSNTQVVS